MEKQFFNPKKSPFSFFLFTTILIGLITAPTIYAANAESTTTIGSACTKIGENRAD